MSQGRLPGRCAVTALAVAVTLVAGAGPARAAFIPFFNPCDCWCVITPIAAGVAGLFSLTSSNVPPTPPEPPPERPCPTGSGMVSLRMLPSATELQVGQSFDVAIMADMDLEIISFGFDVLYNDTLLRLEKIDLAPAFKPLPTSVGNTVAGLAYPTSVVGTDVLVATARFTAMGLGTAEMSTFAESADPTQGFAQRICGFSLLEATPAEVVIVPDPPTVLLLAGGLLCWYRRKR